MMKVVIIDSDIGISNQLKEILLSLNPQNEVLSLSNIKDLKSADLKEETVLKIKQAELLLIAVEEVEELKSIESIKNSQSLLEIKFDTLPDIILTSFNPDKFDRHECVKKGVFNILHKPLDRLIAKELIKAATSKRDQFVVPDELTPQNPMAFAAMVKKINCISICELGFVTLNDGPIPLNSISKYFKDLFSHEKRQSVWAQCILSLEIPDQPGTFINKFQYLGIEQAQLMNIRRYVSQNKANRIANSVWNLETVGNEKAVKIALIGNGDQLQRNLKHDLESHFHNIELDYLQFNRDQLVSQFSGRYECIISLCDDVDFKTLKAHFVHDSVYFLIASSAIAESRLENLIHQYKNVFTYPLDRPYFFKIIKILIKALSFNEVPELYNLTYNENLMAVNPVKIDEVCETFVTFKYHRELPYGTFREIALIAEDEHDYFEIPAYCHRAEKRSSGILHQFLFWGLNDFYLKQLRRWLLHNHVVKNQKS